MYALNHGLPAGLERPAGDLVFPALLGGAGDKSERLAPFRASSLRSLRKHGQGGGLGSFNHQGGWQIVDAERNWLVVGERFDLSLDDVEQWLGQDQDDSELGRTMFHP